LGPESGSNRPADIQNIARQQEAEDVRSAFLHNSGASGPYRHTSPYLDKEDRTYTNYENKSVILGFSEN